MSEWLWHNYYDNNIAKPLLGYGVLNLGLPPLLSGVASGGTMATLYNLFTATTMLELSHLINT